MTDHDVPERSGPNAGLGASLEHRGVTGPAVEVLDGLPPTAAALRAAAFEVLRHGAIPTRQQLVAAAGVTIEGTDRLLETMADAGVIELEGDQVVGSMGLTTRPTAHALVLDGVVLHTWCAVDVFGIPAALGSNAHARSTCSWCGAAHEVTFVGGEPLGTSPLRAWFPHLACSNVRSEFCTQANLFCNPEHLAAWRAGAGDPPGEDMDLASVVAFGRAAWTSSTAHRAKEAPTNDRTRPTSHARSGRHDL